MQQLRLFIRLWVSCAEFCVNLAQLTAAFEGRSTVNRHTIMQLHQIFGQRPRLVPLQVHPKTLLE